MNQNDFTYLLQHPEAITHQQTVAIKSVIDEFPYFQSARAIHLKGLKNQSSLAYNQALKTTAAYTSDRSVLFDFITSEAFIQNEISKYIKQNIAHVNDIEVDIEDITVNKKVTIDDTLKQQIEATTGVLDPSLFEPKEARPIKETTFIHETPATIENAISTQTEENAPETVLSLGQPLPFDKTETHSFNEWLKLSRFKPIERIENRQLDKIKPKKDKPAKIKSPEALEKEKKFDLIDQFIIKNPKINPTKPLLQKGNLAKAQMIQPEALMTETLARIYVEQKNYPKAIQSYKILSLKYPEKSGFFADQIKAVKQLQEQNNKR
ncbi:hypothetical protein ACFFU1_18400 [Algibacter miyuki]|uniref:Tetratricopeptide repeat protein n=1 Tax=Algibacter miyuki TaxID=1306933 RepID=A0ABV5H4T5_9FLAO|nr:hypothetical protein [Algibacter miyuki]MDN3665813.1 hypothetical protein [Algibacter miyuki]